MVLLVQSLYVKRNVSCLSNLGVLYLEMEDFTDLRYLPSCFFDFSRYIILRRETQLQGTQSCKRDRLVERAAFLPSHEWDGSPERFFYDKRESEKIICQPHAKPYRLNMLW